MALDNGKSEHWIFSQHDVRKTGTVLGTGGFGAVLEAELGGTMVAVKTTIHSLFRDAASEGVLLGELRVLRHIRHPNVVLFFGAYITVDSKEVGLIFELVDGVTLDVFVQNEPRPLRCNKGKLEILAGLARALRYMHWLARSIMHGDIKDTNVFVEMWETGPRAKLGDFGLARLIDSSRATNMGGTMRWMAPEILQGEPVKPAKSADVFSFGRLMSFTLTGIKPCTGLQRKQIIQLAQQGQVPELLWPSEGDSLLALRLTDLGKVCVVFDANARPDMSAVARELELCAELGDSSILQLPPQTGSSSSHPSSFSQSEQVSENLQAVDAVQTGEIVILATLEP
ncbi:unnamed protein product [Polarella glacialis]|uniref:Protein kinase domain-containing protein n=1 Tax=Polarella glacialis TaxID=89957 RepID=A0A813HXE9_POLGL|nr:unnamed protein product [Polarella glacialis]CAE8683136.1 unnamed protein product [Polarella glacialis]